MVVGFFLDFPQFQVSSGRFRLFGGALAFLFEHRAAKTTLPFGNRGGMFGGGVRGWGSLDGPAANSPVMLKKIKKP